MRRFIAGMIAMGMLTSGMLASAGTALASRRPTRFTYGQHGCSYTAPEYMLSDWDMLVHTRPGTTAFTAEHSSEKKGYQAAYWVTGYHNENSWICNSREIPGSHGRRGYSYPLPVRLARNPRIIASLHEDSTSRSTRLGFDIWISPVPWHTSPTSLMRDSRTYEILVQQGNGSPYRYGTRWNRWYVPALGGSALRVDVHHLNLSKIIAETGAPRGYYLMAVDAGAESPDGSFKVVSYRLSITYPGNRGSFRKPSGYLVPDIRGQRLRAAQRGLLRHGFRSLLLRGPRNGRVVWELHGGYRVKHRLLITLITR